jgi:hypothetical protein
MMRLRVRLSSREVGVSAWPTSLRRDRPVNRNRSACGYSRQVGRRGRQSILECTLVGVELGIAECPLRLSEERMECPVAKAWENPRAAEVPDNGSEP